MQALLDLNLVLPPPEGSEARNVPTQSGGQQLGVAAKSAGLIPDEVERVLAESDEALRWNAALLLYELLIELGRQFTAPAVDLAKTWVDEGKQGRMLLLDDVLRRGLTFPDEKDPKVSWKK